MSIMRTQAANLIRQKNSAVVPYAATVNLSPLAGRVQKVGPLTGNITIGPAVNPQDGDLLNVIITQDATGGRTITWDASFPTPPTSVTTANGVTVGKFIYAGGFWR